LDPRLTELIEAADLDALVRAVDGLCAARDWEGLVELAERCEDAVERGKQLWPIAALTDYRLALEAPGEYAASVLESELARFMLGPPTEVAASTHTWAELAPYIDSPQSAGYVAQERVLRGEDLRDVEGTHPEVLQLPMFLQSWEPTYALATYKPDHVEVAEPWDPKEPMEPAQPDPAPDLPDDELEELLLDLVSPWTGQSNGAARVAIVEGPALAAAAALTPEGSLRAARLSVDEAMRLLAWAAASGGAYGRRRGAAYGRSAAFFLGTVITDVAWPPDPDELGAALARLEWYRFDEGEPEKGWVLRVAVGDRNGEWGAAISASDVLDDEPVEPLGSPPS
jgi:hypothetical protein